MRKRSTSDAAAPPTSAQTTPGSAKQRKVARVEDALAPAPPSASSARKGGTYLNKVLGAADFVLKDGVDGGNPFFASSKMESSAKVRECFAKNLAKLTDEVHHNKFWSAFVAECKADPRFPVALLSPYHLVSKENEHGGASLDKQDSLFRVLVQSFAGFQRELIDWALELLPLDASIARLALSNMRWLNNIADSEGLTKKLMEVLEGCEAPFQREIIHAIPEVIDDLGHRLTVEGLQRLMEEEPAFTGVILDTYASLNMEPSIVASIRGDLLKRLDSVASEFVPAALKFLLQTTPVKELPTVVGAIRTDLDLSQDHIRSHEATQRAHAAAHKQARAYDYHRMALEALRTAMSFDERVASAFLAAVTASKDVRPLDVWLLLIAHGLTKTRVKVETLVRKKVLSHDLSFALVRRALHKNGNVLIEQFPAVLALADRAVRALEPEYAEFGVQLYCLAFQVFPDPFNRQNLVANVLAHVGSTTSEGECSAGLNVLVRLSEDAESLKEMWQFVETVLDHLVTLSKANLRKAWKMFAALIWKGAPGDALDDKVYGALSMVLRKQLTNMRDVFKRSGVVGTAAVLGQLCGGGAVRKDRGLDAVAHKEFEAHLQCLLGLAEPLYLAMALDELSSVLQAAPACRAPLLEAVESRAFGLVERFVVECTPRSDVVDGAEVAFNLNGNDVANAVNLWAVCGAKTRDEALVLCPALHLLQTVHRLGHGSSLEELGGLLGAPLLVCPPNFVDTFDDLTEPEQVRVTFAVFHAVNWVRETINTFCDQSDAMLRTRLLQRLTTLHDLEEQLERCLRTRPISALLPNMRDPTGAVCAASAAVAAAEPPKKVKKTAASGRKPRKRDGDDEDGDAAAAAAVDTGADLPRVRELSSSLRLWDLPVAAVLAYAATDGGVCMLRPFALHGLLQSLDEHCQRLFDAVPGKRAAPFRKAKDGQDAGSWVNPHVALTDVVAGVVPALAEHLGRVGSYLSTWTASDGAEWMPKSGDGKAPDFDHDAAASASEERARHEFWWYVLPCQRAIFDNLRRVFTWLNAASARAASEDEAKALDALMRTILNRICGGTANSSGSSGNRGLAEAKKECWTYLAALAPSVYSLSTAVCYCSMLEALALYGVGRRFATPAHTSTPEGGASGSGAGAAAALSGEKAYLHELSKFAAGFLRTSWSAASGGVKADDVRTLLEKYLMHAAFSSRAMRSVIDALHVVLETGEAAAAEEEQASTDAAFVTLTKQTVGGFYKTSLACSAKLLKQLALEKSISLGLSEKLAKLDATFKLNRGFKRLVDVVRGAKSTVLIKASALREGKAYLDLVQRAMPFFGHMAAIEPRRAVDSLKEVETASRTLQRLCNIAKEEGVEKLLQLIPAAKKGMEKFIIETGRVMDAAGIGGALKFGSLKHKNLAGEVMASQVSYRGGASAEDDEEDADLDEAVPMDEDPDGHVPEDAVPPKDKDEALESDDDDDGGVALSE